MVNLAARIIALWSVITSTVAQTTFSWNSIEPTNDLQYHDCYNGFKCARLKVPLDWQHPNDNRTIALAITILPASVSEDDPSFGGTVIGIPGGPGGSGVDLIQESGLAIKFVVDSNKKYEILSYDPRGVGFSTPVVNCFGGDTYAREAFALKQKIMGPLDRGRGALERQWALGAAYARVCEQSLRNSDLLSHVSTAAAARDVLEIVDRVDELRRKTLNQTGDHTDPPRLIGLGLSYGTVVANTFASMYPGRVGRLMFDAVVDTYDYMHGWWLASLKDTEKDVQYFYDSCFDAGSECPLVAKNDTSGTDIRSRIESFISDADASPLSVDIGKDVFAITGSDIRRTFRDPFYTPLTGFRPHAQLLFDMLSGNYTSLVTALGIPPIQKACSNKTVADVDLPLDAQSAIACSDADDATGHTIDYYADYINTLKQQSPTWGEYWSTIRFGCANWKVPAAWRFNGPFTAPAADPSGKEGVPLAPLLFISSKYDPACPLSGAEKMASGYPGAGLLVQNSYSHTALAGGWSECTNVAIRTYLENGTLPANGTVCETKCKPWKEAECDQPTAATKRSVHQTRKPVRSWFDAGRS